VHLALLFRNLACGRTKLRGRSGDCALHEQIVILSLPAKCYQKNKGLVSTSSRCIENTGLFSQVVDGRWIVVSSWSSFPNTQTRHLIPMIRAEDIFRLTTAYLNRIATAVPEHDVHDTFVVFAEKMLADLRLRTVF